MSLEVLAPGLLSTVQDTGRDGVRALGVSTGGAVDRYACEVANRLVGNPAGAAVLEFTMHGPVLRLGRAARVAVCGATIDATADGEALPGWRPALLPAGTELAFGACRAGMRAYLAIDGGIDVPSVLGSRATDLRGGFGGHDGRALRTGDVLPLARSLTAPHAGIRIARWWIDAQPDLDFSDDILVRTLRGSDATAPSDALWRQAFQVDAASNRQGLRLRGDALCSDDGRERVSEPVVPGTIQLPPDGQPIVLLADAQTVGGYPRIGHVIAADMSLLAQRRAGQRLRFRPVDRGEAMRALREQRARLARIGCAIAGKPI